MVLRLFLLFILLANAVSAQTVAEARAAVTRALPILQRSAASFVSQRACVSCHHNSLAVVTLRLARQHGFAVDAKTLVARRDVARSNSNDLTGGGEPRVLHDWVPVREG